MPTPEERKPRYPRWKVSTLIQAALNSPDEQRRWQFVVELHFRGDRTTLAESETLCRSADPSQRRLGADILGQLGVPDRTFPAEAARILKAMSRRENSAAVLQAIAVAMGHTLDARASAPWAFYRRLLAHRSNSVRLALAFALMGRDQPVAIRMLIRLSRDRAAKVRDWATFSLGSQTEVDTPAVRGALWAGVADRDAATHREARIGLARRKDPRILKVMASLLGSNPHGLDMETAAELDDRRWRLRLRDLGSKA